jgi:hypothetical protein
MDGLRSSCLDNYNNLEPQKGTKSFFRRHPTPDIVVDMHLQVTLEFVREIAFASVF